MDRDPRPSKMRRMLLDIRNQREEENDEEMESTPRRRSAVRLPRVRLLDTKPKNIPRPTTSNNQPSVAKFTSQNVRKYPLMFPRKSFAVDRFIMIKHDKEASNYLLTRQPANMLKKNEIDVFKQVVPRHMWATLNAVHPVVPTIFDRRTPTVWEEDTPVPTLKERDTVSFQRGDRTYTRTVSTGPGGKDERVTVPTVEHKRTKDMTSAARVFAGKIVADPFKITGALGVGAANRPRVSAVARSLIKLGIGEGRHRQWHLCFSQRFDTLPAERVASFVSLIHQWAKASKPFQVKETLDTSEVVTAVPDTEIDTLPNSAPSGSKCFLRAITVGGNASTLLRAHVCPHSIFFSLTGESRRPINVQGNRYSELQQGAIFDILSGPSLRSNQAGWLAAAAAAHNKEQHALNGNIDNVLSAQKDSSSLYALYRAAFRDGPGVQTDRMTNDGDLIRCAFDASLRTFYSDGPYHYEHIVLTNVATAHQFVGVTEEQVAVDSVADDPVAGDPVAGGPVAGGPEPRDEIVAHLPDMPSTSGMVTSPPGCGPSFLSSNGHENESSSPGAKPPGYISMASGIIDVSDVTPLQTAMPDDIITLEMKTALSRAEDTVINDKKRRKPKKYEKAARGTVPDEPVADKPLVVGVQRPLELEMLAKISRKLKWVAVGVDSKFSIGGLQFTTFGQALVEAATKPDPHIPGVINPGMAPLLYGLLINCPHIAQAMQRAPRVEAVDIRVLALKVALLDMQRERYFAQPSGVEWAWAKPKVPEREIIDLSIMDQWHYDAVFVTTETIEYAMRNRGLLPVDNGKDQWSIADEATMIIGLPINTVPYTMGRTTWILSHLTHPLAWIFEYFDMCKIGGGDSSVEMFCCTAGLVDIHNRVSKLIFVTSTKTQTSVNIGGRDFTLSTVDHHFELPVNRQPRVWNIDNQISTLLRQALTWKTSLRVDFDEFIRPMLSGKINWLEVDSLVNLLTVRYHQRVEGVKINSKSDTTYIGAPRNTLRQMGLLPSPHIAADSYSDYGAANAVTALDHRVSSRQRARQYPIVSIGAWSNIAELGVTTGMAYFHNIENPNNVENFGYRLTSGNLDKIQRSRVLRAYLELWKRRVSLLDIIAFPLEGREREWAKLVNSRNRYTGVCVQDVTYSIMGQIANFSWTVNATLGSAGSTMTGCRLTSSQWRHDYNVSCRSYDPTKESGEGNGRAKYIWDLDRSWAYNKFHQGNALGDRTDGLEYALCRINLTEGSWDITYRDQDSRRESPGVRFCVDSSHGAILASEIGICDACDPCPPPRTWSWGLTTCIKDFARSQLRTLVIGRDVYSAITCGDQVPHTILLTGQCNERFISTIRDDWCFPRDHFDEGIEESIDVREHVIRNRRRSQHRMG